MNIEQISIEGLFNRFNHHITFAPHEHVAIMIGPNGYGKTTVLKILDTLFNNPPHHLILFPFARLEIAFDDGRSLHVKNNRSTTRDETNDHRTLEIEIWRDQTRTKYHKIDPIDYLASSTINRDSIRDSLTIFDLFGSDDWNDTPNEEHLPANYATERRWRTILQNDQNLDRAMPDWLTKCATEYLYILSIANG